MKNQWFLLLILAVILLLPGRPGFAFASRDIFRYRALILTTAECRSGGPETVGEGPYDYRGDPEAEDYREFCANCRLPCDLLVPEELTWEKIYREGKINYTIIIISLPAERLAEDKIALLKRASTELGVSLIASYNRVDVRSRELFGIEKISGSRFQLPITLVPGEEASFSQEVTAPFRLGEGWRLKRSPGGWRRNLKRFLAQPRRFMIVKETPAAVVLARIGKTGSPAIIRNSCGQATNYYIALDCDRYLDTFSSLDRIVRDIIMENSGHGMFCFDLAGTAVLRLDDPGSCEPAFRGKAGIMTRGQWKALAQLLEEEEARLSVMYVPQWIDDGNGERGELSYRGRKQKSRKKGAAYDSKDVTYYICSSGDRDSVKTFDYREAYTGIRDGVLRGNFSVEAHGLTHLDPDLEKWLSSADRYRNPDWYREFRHVRENKMVAPAVQLSRLKEAAAKIEEFFGDFPVAITPPGHEYNLDTLTAARKAGFRMFSSEYTSILTEEPVLRSDRIPAFIYYFTGWIEDFVATGHPMVIFFHDYDIASSGMDWFEQQFAFWRKAGIKRCVSFVELADYLTAALESEMTAERMRAVIDWPTGTSRHRKEDNGGVSAGRDLCLRARLPRGKIPAGVYLNGESWDRVEYGEEKRELTISVPPGAPGDRVILEIWLNQPFDTPA